MLCGHCGFTGDLNEKSITTIKTGGYVSPDGFHDYQWHIHARVMQCPGCENLTFYTYREWHYEDPADWPIKILYPQRPNVGDLPDKVRKSYEKTLPAKINDPASFVVGVGNVLEDICAEHGISKKIKSDEYKELQNKLQELADELKFPNTLVEITRYLRNLRNAGAHGDTVEASDAETAAEFMEAILNYLYRYPAMLKRASQPKRDPERT